MTAFRASQTDDCGRQIRDDMSQDPQRRLGAELTESPNHLGTISQSRPSRDMSD
jgi:hypothetical protein